MTFPLFTIFFSILFRSIMQSNAGQKLKLFLSNVLIKRDRAVPILIPFDFFGKSSHTSDYRPLISLRSELIDLRTQKFVHHVHWLFTQLEFWMENTISLSIKSTDRRSKMMRIAFQSGMRILLNVQIHCSSQNEKQKKQTISCDQNLVCRWMIEGFMNYKPLKKGRSFQN